MIKPLLSLLLLSLPLAAQDDMLYLKGPIVAIEQFVPNISNPVALWYATIRTSKGELRVECSAGPAKTACSTLVASGSTYVPSLLNTGGCYPIHEAVSGGTEGSLHAWTCGGSGGGSCRIANGWIVPEPTLAALSQAIAGTFASCY
jgi:hypothetical protein